MNKKKWSNLLIIIGVLLIVTSILFFCDNQKKEIVARISSENAVEQIREIIEGETIAEENSEILIEDDLYIAILEISAIDMELPIQSSWSYDKLNSSPCIYKTQPLSIAAHNYSAHFGKLGELEIGDTATLTYLSGEVANYQVVLVEKIHETEIEALENSAYDLSLFTCNYSNNTERIVVRLNLISDYNR